MASEPHSRLKRVVNMQSVESLQLVVNPQLVEGRQLALLQSMGHAVLRVIIPFAGTGP